MRLTIFDVDWTLLGSRAMIAAAINRDLADTVVATLVLYSVVLCTKLFPPSLSVVGR